MNFTSRDNGILICSWRSYIRPMTSMAWSGYGMLGIPAFCSLLTGACTEPDPMKETTTGLMELRAMWIISSAVR